MNEFYQADEVIPYMRGMWRDAFKSICGLDDKTLSGKHGPCPVCGGKDRFRFSDNLEEKGDGGAFCTQCGGDKGVGWLSRLTGEPYSECVNILGKFLGKVPVEYVVKKNKAAIRDSGYSFGAQADPERCEALMSRAVDEPQTPLSLFEGFTAESYIVGKKTRPDGSCELIHAIPCHLVHSDGPDDEMCNVALYNEEGVESFLAGTYTRGSVCRVSPGTETIYLCRSWIDAMHVHTATNQEAWACFEPSNAEIVAHRYKGDRKVRIACAADDLEMIYVAEDRDLEIITPNGESFRQGARRRIFKASDLL